MQAARFPQSKPASATSSRPRVSAKSTTSWAIAACSAIRGASGIEKPGRPVPAQVRHEHSVPRLGQGRRDPVPGADVIGESVEQDDGKAPRCRRAPRSRSRAPRCAPSARRALGRLRRRARLGRAAAVRGGRPGRGHPRRAGVLQEVSSGLGHDAPPAAGAPAEAARSTAKPQCRRGRRTAVRVHCTAGHRGAAGSLEDP